MPRSSAILTRSACDLAPIFRVALPRCNDQDLLDAVQAGLDRDSARREREQALSGLVSAYGTLTAREQQVFPLFATGLMNKQIAAKLGIVEITVKGRAYGWTETRRRS